MRIDSKLGHCTHKNQNKLSINTIKKDSNLKKIPMKTAHWDFFMKILTITMRQHIFCSLHPN
jgi:hypothetical protein